jgi:hypothetical protein
MTFIYSVLEALKKLSNKEILKLSIYNGIFWAVFWIVIAVISWKYMFEFTSFMLNLLPFKFIQNAGAEFLYMISWLQIVLITIGVIFVLFNDFLKNKIYSIILVMFTAIFWLFVFLSYKNSIIGYLEKLIRIFPFESIEEAVSVVFAVFIYYSFFIVSMYLGFLLLSERFLLKIVEEDYPSLTIKSNFSKIKILKIIAKDFFVFLIALMVLYPLLFVPFFNLFVIVGLWAYVIKNAIFETIFSILGHEVINKKIEWGFAVISVFFNFIPLVNLFSPAFGLLSIYYYVIEKKYETLENQ